MITSSYRLSSTLMLLGMLFIAPLFMPQVLAEPTSNIQQHEAYPKPIQQVLSVESELFTEKSADFMVSLPHNYQQNSAKSYVVMLDLHPRSHLLHTGMHDWMSHNGGWPWLETIIITAPDGHQGLGKLKELAIEEKGNQQLLDFFEQDLLPTIDRSYRTNGFKILNGFTGNAGLGLYTLINRPELFNAYIAASPVLSRDFGYVLKDASEKLKNLKLKQQRFLFVSTSDSGYEQGQLPSFAELESILKQADNSMLNYKVQRFDGSYYMTQPVLATAMGIEMIFNDIHNTVQPDSELGKQGAQAILAHYKTLSQQVYGFEVSAVGSLTALAQSQFTADAEQAIATLELAIANYPTNPHALAALAEIYIELDNQTKANSLLRKAMTLTEHPFWLNKWGKLVKE
ncbi:alpha/beta hydrolase-fold protein [Shewanella sp. WXL01]|uniref:alpha/beta hydrolase-fold protein n=1 Tax=Shewanella sp. WXL01 TaxID=2709721 RepID=UPI001FD908D4|nr:alpha/beta hydrolase-fold protein [Shewanella sp. WXL01]